MPLFLFLIFSGFLCENFPIWIQTASSCFKSVFSPELHIFRGDRRGGEYLYCTCFNDIGLIHTPICFVCGVTADISYNYPQVEFVCEVCVGKVLISLIGRDRWAFMIKSCGN